MSPKSSTADAGRRHVEGKPNLPVFAGSLRHELESHVLQRAEYFFYYVATMKIVVAELNKIAAAGGKPARSYSGFVLAKATDQIGSGMRSEDTSVYSPFVTADAGVVDLPTTHFTSSDAAHFCNLGLAMDMASACLGSPFTRDGYERLKVYAGATKQLPQQVNIGVDRKLDVLHAKLGVEFLDSTDLIFSLDRVKTYREQAVAEVTDYRDAKRADRKPGLAACADCYLAMYDSADFAGRVFRRVYPEIVGMCESSPSFRGQSHHFYR